MRGIREPAGGRPRLVLLAPTPAPDPLDLVAREIAELAPQRGDLTLPLRLSAAFEGCGIDLDDASGLLVRLRSEILRVWGIDRQAVPTPLVSGNTRDRVLRLVDAVDEVLEVVVAATGIPRHEVVSTTLRLAS
jgi:hypothetical protein